MNKKYIVVGGVWVLVFVGLFFVMTKQDKSITSNHINTMSTTNTNTTMNENMNTNNVTELKIEDEVVGTGDVAKAGDTVTVHYVGALTNGTVFDASRKHGDQGFSFSLGRGQVIRGWDMGVAGMKVGGKRKLTIPSDLAYGNQAVGGVIPANSTLIFEVELLKVSR